MKFKTFKAKDMAIRVIAVTLAFSIWVMPSAALIKEVKDYGKQFRGSRICIAVRISQEQNSDGRQGHAVCLCVDSCVPPV